MECVLCAVLSCMPGFYSSGCSAGSTQDASCLRCAGGAAVGQFVWTRGCEYECASDYHRVNSSLCMPCSRPRCGAGFYASDCSDSSDTVCLACAPPVAGPLNWTSGCEWVCADGYYLGDEGCVPCTASACFPGFRPVACTRTTDTLCVACDAPGGDQGGFVWSETGLCETKCVDGYYRSGAECVRCSSRVCAAGTYLVGCNATADARCASCATPVGDFVWSAGCSFSCATGWRNGSSQCSQCSSPACGAGFYASVCTRTSDSACLPCVGGGGAVGSFVWTAGCGFSCASGFYRSQSACVRCSTPVCAAGTQLQACTAASDAVCLGCSNVQPTGRVVWGGGGGVCGFSCASGAYRIGNDCVDCTRPWCAPGMRVGQCSAVADAGCEACVPPVLGEEGSFFWTGDGECVFDCVDGFFMTSVDGQAFCARCSDDGCGPGSHRVGCNSVADAVCEACQDISDPGGAVWTQECEFVCDAGFYLSDSACRTCSAPQCAPGFLLSACNATSDATCVACPLPSYSGVMWNASGSCAFACEVGFYKSGGQCRRCTQPQCGPGTRLIPCGVSTDAVCVGCDAPVFNGYSWRVGCEFDCLAGYFRQGNVCRPCTTTLQCVPGSYPQDCTALEDAKCVACDSYYFGYGANWSVGCEFACIQGFFMAGMSCNLCTDALTCPVDSLAIGCNATHDTVCVDCVPPGEAGSFIWIDSPERQCQFTCNAGFYAPLDSGTTICTLIPPPEPMAFVVVSTALAMNNTVVAVCDDLETLLQALSDAMTLVMKGANESTGLTFITNVTAFNDKPCIANVCPQCGGVFNLSSLLVPPPPSNSRRLLSSGVSLTTVSTSTTPVVQAVVSSAPPPEQFQSALVVSLASVAPTLVPSGVVAQVSSVLVPIATPAPTHWIYDNGSMIWINAGVSVGALTVVTVIVFVVVCVELVRERAPKAPRLRVKPQPVEPLPQIDIPIVLERRLPHRKKRHHHKSRPVHVDEENQ